MSRIVDIPITVETLEDAGYITPAPAAIVFLDGTPSLPVVRVLGFHRQWVGILQGEPERDVWCVETGRGIARLYGIRRQTADGEGEVAGWLLHAWED